MSRPLSHSLSSINLPLNSKQVGFCISQQSFLSLRGEIDGQLQYEKNNCCFSAVCYVVCFGACDAGFPLLWRDAARRRLLYGETCLLLPKDASGILRRSGECSERALLCISFYFVGHRRLSCRRTSNRPRNASRLSTPAVCTSRLVSSLRKRLFTPTPLSSRQFGATWLGRTAPPDLHLSDLDPNGLPASLPRKRRVHTTV